MVAVGLFAPLWLCSCDPTQADCDALVPKLNASVHRLRPQRVTDAGPPAEVVTSMRRFGTAVDEEADGVATLALKAPRLVAERDAYVSASRATARAAIGWADAIDARRRAQQKGEAARAELESNLDELEERCSASTCFELMEHLAGPTKASSSTMPDELEALAGVLARITTDDAAIDAVIARHRAAIQRLAAALRDMRRAHAEADRHRKILDGAATKEATLVDRINGICRR